MNGRIGNRMPVDTEEFIWGIEAAHEQESHMTRESIDHIINTNGKQLLNLLINNALVPICNLVYKL